MFTPSEFLLGLASGLETLLSISKGLPAYKLGQRYYVAPGRHVDIYISKHFADGVYLIKDMVTAYNNVKSLMLNDYVNKDYPLLTRADKYGFSILKDGMPLPYVPLVTSDSLISKFLAKQLYRNIREILKALKEQGSGR
jgi:hypothetical protein